MCIRDRYYSTFEFSMVQQILIMMIGPIAFLLIMPDYRCQLMKLVNCLLYTSTPWRA